MLENVLLSNVVELKCVFNMYSNELCVQKFLLLINKCDEERWKPRPSFRQKINSFVILDPLLFFFPKKPPCKWNKQDREKLSPLIITTALHTAHSTSTVHCTDQTSSCRFCWEKVVKHAFKMKNDHVLSYEYHHSYFFASMNFPWYQ